MLSIRSDFFFVLGARDWAAYLSPFLQGKRTLNSVFCKNRGYNRKNLYPERLLIAVFCILGWLEIALTYALAGISRYDDGHLFLSDNLDSISYENNLCRFGFNGYFYYVFIYTLRQ